MPVHMQNIGAAFLFALQAVAGLSQLGPAQTCQHPLTGRHSVVLTSAVASRPCNMRLWILNIPMLEIPRRASISGTAGSDLVHSGSLFLLPAGKGHISLFPCTPQVIYMCT